MCHWSKAYEKLGKVLAVSLDISMILDKIWHGSLISKLPLLGLCYGTVFLRNLSFRVEPADGTPTVNCINIGFLRDPFSPQLLAKDYFLKPYVMSCIFLIKNIELSKNENFSTS